MAEIFRVIDAGCICLELEARDKRQAISELVAALAAAGRIESAAVVEKALLEREELANTGIGDGVAVPHALMAEVPETVMAIGRSARGIDFGAPDRKPAHLVFLMVGPAGREHTHLILLSRLARLVRDADFRSALLRAGTVQEMVSVFREREVG